MSRDRIATVIANPLAAVRSDAELLDFAAHCAQSVREDSSDEALAESSRKLIVAVTALLRDWFPASDYTPLGTTTLLSMALMRGKYDSKANFSCRKTPLDLMFNQIESGEKYVKYVSGGWSWRKSSLVRGEDGARPAETKAIHECLLRTSSLGSE